MGGSHPSRRRPAAHVTAGSAAADGPAHAAPHNRISAFLRPPMNDEQRAMVAALNDQARRDITTHCQLIATEAFSAAYAHEQDAIIAVIKTYDVFDCAISNFDERDFGVVFRLPGGSWTDQTPGGDWIESAIFWHFAYTDRTQERPSLAPWDATQSARVLILMLPHEFI